MPLEHDQWVLDIACVAVGRRATFDRGHWIRGISFSAPVRFLKFGREQFAIFAMATKGKGKNGNDFGKKDGKGGGFSEAD